MVAYAGNSSPQETNSEGLQQGQPVHMVSSRSTGLYSQTVPQIKMRHQQQHISQKETEKIRTRNEIIYLTEAWRITTFDFETRKPFGNV